MSVSNFVKSNIGVIGAGTGGVVLGGALGFIAGRKSRKKRKNKRASKVYHRRKKNYTHKRGSGRRRTPHTAGKRKDTSHRRIRYTKNGQPYIIMASGKARFISMKSAHSSHKRRGGRY